MVFQDAHPAIRACFRHKDWRRCPIAALARYLFELFTDGDADFPNLDELDAAAW